MPRGEKLQKLETAKMSKMEKEGRMREKDEKRRSGIGLMICAGNACPERLSPNVQCDVFKLRDVVK